MSESVVLEIGQRTIEVALMVALPMLVVSMVIGLLVSLLQVATSLQDVTLTFVPKIIAVGLTVVLAGSWLLGTLVSFAHGLFAGIPELIG